METRKTIRIYTCYNHDQNDMNSIEDISIETVGVADFCPVCKSSLRHAQRWKIDVDDSSRAEVHFDKPKGSQIGRTYTDYEVIPNSAELIGWRERGEYGDWYHVED